MNKRNYLIQRSSRKCIYVLIMAAVIAAACFAAMLIWFSTAPTEEFPNMGQRSLRYFTLLSNLFAGLASTIIVAYAIDGLKKKSFMPTAWAVRFQYAGTICTTITMLVVLFFLWPFGGNSAVSGINFLLHIVCPMLQLLLFFFAESNIMINRRDMLVSTIPFLCYAVLYCVEVFAIGEENGGWQDFYKVTTLFSFPVALVIFIILGVLVAFLLRLAHNKQIGIRRKKTRRMIAELFENDKYMLLLEAYGMGTDMGGVLIGDELSVPTGFFQTIADVCPEVRVEELCAAYLKGTFFKAAQSKKDGAPEDRQGKKNNEVIA